MTQTLRVLVLLHAAFLPAALGQLKKSKAPDLKDGDLVFQNSQSYQCQAILAATKSQYSHVGIVFIEGGTPFVYEAVQPVRKTPLRLWIQRAPHEHYLVKRLRDPAGFDPARLKREASRYLGRNYDLLFDWSDDCIYCSELVWKSYQRGCGIELAKLRELREFDLEHPAVKPLVRERYGDKIPYEMKVVAPSDLLDSALLFTVDP